MTIDFHDKAIGVAVTGSFCTFRQVFEELESLAQTGASLYTIFSDNAYHTDSRFGAASGKWHFRHACFDGCQGTSAQQSASGHFSVHQ